MSALRASAGIEDYAEHPLARLDLEDGLTYEVLRRDLGAGEDERLHVGREGAVLTVALQVTCPR
jgi:hypothetical protein